jgi:excisionase family DNA binding protein
MPAEILSPREAAAYLKVSHSTLAHMRMKGTGPKYFRVGSQVRYRLADLQQYAEEQIAA